MKIPLPDPKRDQPLPAAAVIEHFDDAARRDVAHRRANFCKPVAFRRGDIVHGPASWGSRPPEARGCGAIGRGGGVGGL